MLPPKETLGSIAVALTFVAFAPYIYAILKGTVRPHVFSWVIWALTTTVVFLATLADDGGAGAWAIATSGGITFFIAVLAYLKRNDVNITKSDWAIFVLALSALPVWYLTTSPLHAVIILSFVDMLGFIPTLKKAYHQPYSESLLFFGLFITRTLLVILALENYSLTTLLFPCTITLLSLLIAGVVVVRRNSMA